MFPVVIRTITLLNNLVCEMVLVKPCFHNKTAT